MVDRGRGLVCLPGARVPPPFDRLPRIEVHATTPRETVDLLHLAWLNRRPVVLELHVTKSELKQPESWEGDVYSLAPDFELTRERLHFLTWANNYDATLPGDPVWWHGRLSGDPATDGGPRGDFAGPHREGPTRDQPRSGLPLAPDQEVAVVHRSGPARILAPAGSGKTRVLTERLRHLLVDRGYGRERVTALAYNRRAAEEMRERTGDFKPRISTLHALGYGLLGRPRLLEEKQVREILESLVTVPQALNQDPLAPYLEALAEIRLALCTPKDVEERRSDVPGLTQLFPAYRERLRGLKVVDHDEQIYGAIESLLRDPALRKQAQEGCTHLLVDEFQDLTPAYLLLVRLLAAPAYQVFGVGDDDQVIYGYAGATPEFLLSYDRYFPGAATYQLEVNYRCPGGVVRAAVALLERNSQRVPKVVRPGPTASEGEVAVVRAAPLDWAMRSLRQVQDWLQRYDPGEIALLTRVRASLLPLQVNLASAGIPFRGLLDATVLQRTGLRAALAYLRLARGRVSRGDLADTLRRPNRRLRREILDRAAACRSLDEIERFAAGQEPWPESQLVEFVANVRALRRLETTGARLRYLREGIGLGDALVDLDNDASSSHLDDLVALEQAAALHPEPDGFEEWLSELLGRSGGSGVRLSTVHRVKGMEWSCVLVYGAQNGLLPHRLSDDLEEERRIFHVAITRARREIVVVADAERPSPFLDELLPRPQRSTAWRFSPTCPSTRSPDSARWPVGKAARSAGPDLSRLKPKERRVYELYLEGHSLPEIALLMDKSQSACETWLQLARRQLER